MRCGISLPFATTGNSTYEYTYTADGTRTGKTVGDVEHVYYYADGKLRREQRDGTNIDFFYDASGAPYAFRYGGVYYYYITNLQGDVVRIVNSSGTVVATYKYDPWGNITSSTGTMASVNPLRYRGYYYDSETGFYYLMSRYYDPEIGRFINADVFASTGQGLLGNNMFAYCLNNPVNYLDRAGANSAALQWWITKMGWVPLADGSLPFGEVFFLGVLFLLASASEEESTPELSYDNANTACGPPSPNDDDDDDYDPYEDDYYSNDNNFGGRQKVGSNKGRAPRNNKAQNDQFDYAAKKAGIKPQKIRAFHDYMTGQGEDIEELIAMAETFVSFFFSVFRTERE